jgi:hypothetical protein
MANTMTLIASSTVGSGGASSIAFSSIPSTYTDLVVKSSVKNTLTSSNWADMQLQLNGSTSSFTGRSVFGYATNALSNTDTNPSAGFSVRNSTASTFSNCEVYLPNYTSSNYKSWSLDAVTEANDATTAITWLGAYLWSNTAAVTSITIASIQGTFDQYSTFYLYGINKS